MGHIRPMGPVGPMHASSRSSTSAIDRLSATRVAPPRYHDRCGCRSKVVARSACSAATRSKGYERRFARSAASSMCRHLLLLLLPRFARRLLARKLSARSMRSSRLRSLAAPGDLREVEFSHPWLARLQSGAAVAAFANFVLLVVLAAAFSRYVSSLAIPQRCCRSMRGQRDACRKLEHHRVELGAAASSSELPQTSFSSPAIPALAIYSSPCSPRPAHASCLAPTS